jgi:uncharacterized protein
LVANPNLLRSVGRIDGLIWDAIRTQSVGLTRFLLQHGVSPNGKTHGSYPLLEAIAYRNIDIVRLLLESGADISLSDHVGRSLLEYCEVYGATPDIVDLLKAHGAS